MESVSIVETSELPRSERTVVVDFLRKALPGNFEKYLEGIDFPIGKQELVQKLKQNDAPGMVVDQVGKRLPEGEYQNPQDLIKKLRG